jgi:hypothetical protein
MASGRLSKVKGKVVDIPNPPTIGTATAGGESVSIAFTADSSGKGGPTRSYIAKSNPGNITATGSTSPINVTGLTVGTSYTISVAGVNETGTGEYSSASGSATPIELTSFESIATVALSGSQSTITFSSIPQTYKHLQLRLLGRTDRASADDYFSVRFNSDNTAANYRGHYLIGEGANVYSGDHGNDYAIYGRLTGASASSNMFGVGVIDMLDYTNTNKYKTGRNFGGQDINGSAAYAWNGSSLWMSTSAITSFVIYPGAGSNFVQYTHAALYGIKG